MRRLILRVSAACFVASLTWPVRAEDRQIELDKLVAEFDAARESYFQQRQNRENPSPQELINGYEAYPLWSYLPKVVAIAETRPNDSVALEACKWIIDACDGNNDSQTFGAELTAWRIISEHHENHEGVPLLCLQAANGQSPAREAFLRDLVKRDDLPGRTRAFALLALAEYLTNWHRVAEAGARGRGWNLTGTFRNTFAAESLPDGSHMCQPGIRNHSGPKASSYFAR